MKSVTPDEPFVFLEDVEVMFSRRREPEQPSFEERAYQIMDMANLVRFENALKEIVNILGPEDLVDGCPDCHAGCPGLLAEASEALAIAKQALQGKHYMPLEEKE